MFPFEVSVGSIGIMIGGKVKVVYSSQNEITCLAVSQVARP